MPSGKTRAGTPRPGQFVRDVLIIAAVLAGFGGVAIAWLIAQPAGPDAIAWPAMAALGSAVLLLGLGGLPLLGTRPPSRTIGVVAGVWLLATVVCAWVRTADQVGIAPGQVGLGQFGSVLAGGAPELVAGIAALLVLGWAVTDVVAGTDIPTPVVALLAAIGIVVISVSGHPGRYVWGPVLVGAHAVAAAWWCGSLAAMILAVRGRSGWAATLPEFSRWAPYAVGVIAVTGVVAGLAEVGVDGLLDTAYGRILIAKVIGLIGLLGVAAWHRRHWLPDARRHRTTERVSLRSAIVEVLLMSVVLGLAAGLSATPP